MIDLVPIEQEALLDCGRSLLLADRDALASFESAAQTITETRFQEMRQKALNLGVDQGPIETFAPTAPCISTLLAGCEEVKVWSSLS